MTPRDFCYWLQGYFEIGGQEHDVELSADRLAIINKHLQLVFESEFDSAAFVNAAAGNEFCNWLSGLIEGCDCTSGLPASTVKKIRKRLSDVFVHKIDPTFTNREALQRIHKGRGKSRSHEDEDGNESEYEAMC